MTGPANPRVDPCATVTLTEAVGFEVKIRRLQRRICDYQAEVAALRAVALAAEERDGRHRETVAALEDDIARLTRHSYFESGAA